MPDPAVRPKLSIRSCDSTEDIEQRRISRDLQVRIEKAVNQQACATEQCGKCYRRIEIPTPIPQFLEGSANCQGEEPQHRQKAENPRFHQQLQVIVVSVVYQLVGVETAELRKDNGKSSQTPAEHRFFSKHDQRIAVD